jgi:predicted nucleic acid-binding protein
VAFYADTSALVKLVVAEPETDALLTWLSDEAVVPVTCDLARTELMRAVRRGAPDRAVQARAVLDAMAILAVTADVFEEAGRLEPRTLRSLDAIHLAAALALGDDLQAMVAYDDRLAAAARANGIEVITPR